MKIAVAGSGYVDFPVAVLLAQHYEVVALDIATAKVDQINELQSPIEDAGLLSGLHPRPVWQRLIFSSFI